MSQKTPTQAKFLEQFLVRSVFEDLKIKKIDLILYVFWSICLASSLIGEGFKEKQMKQKL